MIETHGHKGARIFVSKTSILTIRLNSRNSVDAVCIMAKEIEIKWLSKPQERNYTAAISYLSLPYDEPTVSGHIESLKRAPMSKYMAKDIFRASGLSLLGVSNSRVKTDKKKIKGGKPLSPLLLIRDSSNGKVIIADGYHRLCAVYSYDEDALIPCKIV